MLGRAVATALSISLVVAMTTAPAAASEGHGHHKKARGPVGLLIVDHGEPPEYNEFTYWSFREFFNHLIEMGLIPSWVKAIDGGTVLTDRACYACPDPSTETKLMDAWLHPYDGPAAFVPGSDNAPAHYLRPGGPGAGEPDIFEHVGLAAWNEWELMGGRSPNFDQKLAKKKAVIRAVRKRYGNDLPVAVGYGIDPRLDGGHQGLRPALARLVNRDRVRHLVVAYHGVGFSDIMQTHMIRHEIHETLDEMEAKVSLSYAQPVGASGHFVRSVAQHVRQELRSVPTGAPVAIHLSGHGLPTAQCGDYNCGNDAYHRASRRLFDRVRRAIDARIERTGRVGVFHLYGDGATDEDDPDDKVDSPIEALAKRKKAGFRYVVDVPYEFDSDSRDTLIILRRGYERPIPDWNHNFESNFKHRGMKVKITNSSFGARAKTRAFREVVLEALKKAVT